MRLVAFTLTLHLGVALLLLCSPSRKVATIPTAPPQWPTHFAGRPLTRVALSQGEDLFNRDFPGHIARFTDGSREIIMRRLRTATRRLHPVADCLKGAGYAITPQPIRVDAEGQHWGCVRAVRRGKQLLACERINDGQGQGWSDVSSWYWATLLGKTSGPWWAVTVAEARAG